MYMYRKTLLMTITFTLVITSMASETYSKPPSALNSVVDIESLIPDLVSKINWTNIKKHVMVLSSFETRMTGYPECWEAAKYIKLTLESYGIKTYMDNYTVTIPYDYGANLTLSSGEVYKIYPVWPNIVAPPTTPPEGVKGRLVYIGRGTLEDMNGREVNGSIVLIDYNSRFDWVKAIGLGAKAVIFIEPVKTTRRYGEYKKLPMAVNILRYYIKRKDAIKILSRLARGEEIHGVIKAKMIWENRQAPIVIGVIPGEIDEIIQVWSYFDSYSVVPSVAPGVDEASGVATMLEIARILSQRKPYRTVMFVALSGHFIALSGAREYVEKYFFGEKKEIGDKTILIIGLDLSTESYTCALYYGVPYWAGKSFYIASIKNLEPFRSLAGLLFENGKMVTKEMLPKVDISDLVTLQSKIGDESLLYYMMKVTGKKYYVGNGIEFSTLTGTFVNKIATVATLYIDTEAATMAGKLAVSFSTSRTQRLEWCTPSESLKSFNLNNLKPQAEFILCSIYLLANLKDLGKYGIKYLPATRWDTGRYAGYLTIRGKVVTYSSLEGRYIPVPHALIYVISYRLHNYEIIVMADEKGEFVIHGGRNSLEPVTGGPPHTFEAFVVNPETGNVIYAEDYGIHGATFYTSEVVFSKEEGMVTLAVFKCATIALFDLLDPDSMETGLFDIKVLDARSHAEPLQYGRTDILLTSILKRWNYRESIGDPVGPISLPVIAVFVPENIPIELLIQRGPVLIGFLTNNTYGYRLKAGQVLKLYAPLEILRDVHNIDDTRLNVLHSFFVYSGGYVAESHHEEADNYLELALASLKTYNYTLAFSAIAKAWNREFKAYMETKSLMYDTIYVAIFFTSLLLIFALIAEKVIIEAKGLRKILTVSLMILLFTAVIYYIHPGYTLATNIFMVLIGLSIIYMLFLTVTLILNEVKVYAREVKESILGVHEVLKSRFDAFSLAFSFGIGYMKRRKIRAGLTMASIVIVVLSLVLLSSAYAYSTVLPLPQAIGEALYEGILVQAEWDIATHTIYTLSLDLVNFLKYSHPKALIAPRTYWNPRFAEHSQLRVKGPNGTAVIVAIWGLAPEEEKVSGLWSKAGIIGSWFTPRDRYVCIISDDIAKEAGFDIGDVLQLIGGLNFTIIGIINGRIAYSLIDLNGDPITPIDYYTLSVNPTVPEFPRLYKNFIIIPFETSLELGASIINVAIVDKSVSPEKLNEVAIDISFTTGKDTYVGSKGTVTLYRRRQAIKVEGWTNIIVPTLIGILVILNTILGNVYERIREFSTLSVLGLSPMEVASMLFGESLVYAVSGGFLGYLLALSILRSLIFFNLLPTGIALNYSSWFVIIAISAAMLITVMATIYPVLKVSKVVTPSLSRKWKVPKPKGEEWEIRTPFSAMEGEVKGVMAYMKEYLEAYGHERLGPFMLISDIVYRDEMSPEGFPVKRLVTRVSLPPHEQGVTQEVSINAIWDSSRSLYHFTIYLRHLTGSYDLWVRLNYPFIDSLRKQLLLWRGLKPESKSEYIKKSSEIL